MERVSDNVLSDNGISTHVFCNVRGDNAKMEAPSMVKQLIVSIMPVHAQ